MTLKETYTALEGDYEDILRRFGSERTIQKFVLKFLDDKSFDNLCIALEENASAEAFRAAHTIKGMCQNLSFTKLAQSSSMLTEALRSGDLDGARALFGRVCEDYGRTVDAIRTFQAEISQ